MRLLCDQWIDRENRFARPTAILTATVAGALGGRMEIDDLLPFPPPRRYLDEEASMAYLDRFFGAK